MDHVVYVTVPPDDDADAIAHAATRIGPREFDFAVLERDEPRAPTGVELAFRISGASSPEQAVGRAQEVYALSREEAGLPPDPSSRGLVGIWPASG